MSKRPDDSKQIVYAQRRKAKKRCVAQVITNCCQLLIRKSGKKCHSDIYLRSILLKDDDTESQVSF